MVAPTPRVLLVGPGNMGLSHGLGYARLEGFDLAGICARSINDPAAICRSAGRGAALHGFTRRLRRGQAGRRLDQHVSRTMPTLRSTGDSRPGAHVFVEKPLAETVADAQRVVAAAEATGGSWWSAISCAYHPVLDEVHRDRADPGQAAGDAHEPQPAVGRPGLDLAQEPDAQPAAAGRLRRALCRRDVPDDRSAAGAGACASAHICPTRLPRTCTITAICRWSSTMARSAGTRPDGDR